jgi:uncharacterized membrane protein
MRPWRLEAAIPAVAVCAIIATGMEFAPIPQVGRILPGILLAFGFPGFAAVHAVVSPRNMATGERLLASVAVSVVIAVCTSVILDATVGLSQRSVATALGAVTLVACVFAWLRESRRQQSPREQSAKEQDRSPWQR